MLVLFCFFKQKTAYEMRISDWSSDVCSSDLVAAAQAATPILILKKASGELFVDIPAIEMVLGQPTDEAVDDPDRISCRDRTVAVFAQPRRIQVDAVPEWPRPQIADRPATVQKIIQRHSFLLCDECRGAA